MKKYFPTVGPSKACRGGLLLLSIFFGIFAEPWSTFSADQKALSDPIVRGAWLYKGNCVRCHGDYEKDRIGGDYHKAKTLSKAIERGKCQISWGRRYGGKLGGRDIRALAAFMLKWEELDAEPPLPELPPLPSSDSPINARAKSSRKKMIVPQAAKDTLSPKLRLLIKTNSVADGARLYTQNCYRCHLSYTRARMGRGITIERVKQTIINGKTATQMRPFARTKGGKLSNGDIKAVADYIAAWEKLGEPLALAPGLTTPPHADPSELVPIGLPEFPKIKGNPRVGQVLYAKHCSRCHGARGEGYIGRRLSTYSSVIRGDLRLKSIIKDGIPGSLMPAWSGDKGGVLDPRQIEDVVGLIAPWQMKRRQ